MLTAAVAATAAVVTLTVVLPQDGASAPPGASEEAVALLEDAALAAEGKREPDGVRDEQFVYVRSRVGYLQGRPDGPPRLEPVHQREAWLSVDGSRWGLLRERNDTGTMRLEPDTPGVEGNTNYRHLQTLPTDPARMLRWLHRVAEGGESDEQNAFVLVGDLARESLLPPDTAAALFRAAARISGVTVVSDAVDAAGRRGVAVARENDGERVELIFHPKTKTFLGERSVATEDLSHGPREGAVTGRSAVLERAVVDRPGQRPDAAKKE
ncbi:hypothetical protein E0L36_14350 [Streptomyces sp. AJS327]|nr:hypothetical protein [Streptomyces sp. AJS327]